MQHASVRAVAEPRHREGHADDQDQVCEAAHEMPDPTPTLGNAPTQNGWPDNTAPSRSRAVTGSLVVGAAGGQWGSTP